MTLNRLHKLLGELIAQGHGRREVYVDKSSFRDNRESDGVCIMPVCEIDVQTYELADDDGGWALDARGCVKTRTSLVIYGDSRDRAAHETNGGRS